MNDECTRAEAMIFAVAVHEAVNESDSDMPSVVIMETATKVDFSSDTLPQDVRMVVAQLTKVSNE